MQNRFFAMMARMKLIRRWGLMFSTRDENLSEHSLDTAFFMHALLALHNRRFLAPGEEPLDLGTGVLLAIYHPRYLPYLKAADRFSALVKCMEETRQGNFEFRRAAAQTREAITAMALPEADCFLQDFIPAFEKTLDELQTQEEL